MWITYLNLENMYGTSDSLDKVLERALQYNNKKHVLLEMCKIFEGTEKHSECEEMFDR